MNINKVVIPAAGMGTRFLPATKALPKEMLPIVDKPSIQYVVEEAIDAGLDNAMIITGRGKRALEDHFDHSYELESFLEAKGENNKLNLIREFDKIQISYTRQKKALGLGHAILQAKTYIGEDSFVVMLPDDIIPDGGRLLSKMKALSLEEDATVISLIEVSPDEVNKYGMAAFKITDDSDIVDIIDLVEKPNIGEEPSLYAVAGRYVITSDIFNILELQSPGKGGEIQLTDALKTMANSDSHKVKGLIHRGKRFDTGDKLGLIQANINFALQRHDLKDELILWLKKLLEKEGK